MFITRSALTVLLLCSVTAGAQAVTLVEPASRLPIIKVASGCLENGDYVRGTLRFVKTKHPNGTPIEVYQLQADGQQCVTGQIIQEGQKVEVNTLHVVLPDGENSSSLQGLLGKKVVVSGDYMESHTAWHIGDAVVLNAKVDPAN